MQIFIHRADQEFGPYSLDQIRGFLVDNSVTAEDWCREEGDTDWSLVRDRLGQLFPPKYVEVPVHPPAPPHIPNTPTPAHTPAPPKKTGAASEIKGLGCFNIGCLSVAAVPVLFILLAAITSPFIRDQSHSYSGVSQNGNSSYQIDVGEKDTFALLDRASIPDWERDSNPDNNSAIASVIASLENQARGYDPDSYEGKALITQLTTMVENYVNSAQQQYVSGGKAELITPGAYTVAGYFDKDGEPIDPRGGDMDWCQITYSKS